MSNFFEEHLIPLLIMAPILLWFHLSKAKSLKDNRMYKTNVLFHGDGDADGILFGGIDSGSGNGVMLLMKTELFTQLHFDWASQYLTGRNKYPKLFSKEHEFDKKIVVKLLSTHVRESIVNDPEICRLFISIAENIPKAYGCVFNNDGIFAVHFPYHISQRKALAHKEFLDKVIPNLCKRINELSQNFENS